MALASYNTNGSFDSSFDTDGKLTTAFNSFGDLTAVYVQPDGKLLAIGSGDNGADSDLVMARYNDNGALDTTFDADGKLFIDPGGSEGAYKAARQEDGRWLILGYSGELYRLERDGAIDASFGTSGVVTLTSGVTHAGVTWARGNAYVVGYDGSGATYDFAVSAYHAGLSERVYYQQDANHNVTSITDEMGAVLQRAVYTPYGQRTTLAANFTGTSDAYGLLQGHQGGRYDAVTGLYNFRMRDYDPSMGTWMEADPIGYPDGASRYEFVTGNPARHTDPSGLNVKPEPPRPLPPFLAEQQAQWESVEYARIAQRLEELNAESAERAKSCTGDQLGQAGPPPTAVQKTWMEIDADIQKGWIKESYRWRVAEKTGTRFETFRGAVADAIFSRTAMRGSAPRLNLNSPYQSTSPTAAALRRPARTEGMGNEGVFVNDLSHVTGKTAMARNQALTAVINEELSSLRLTFPPQYSPYVAFGRAKDGVGSHIGSLSFCDRSKLRNSVVHEELHHRWWDQGIDDHHPLGTPKEARFYYTLYRYEKLRGWVQESPDMEATRGLVKQGRQ